MGLELLKLHGFFSSLPGICLSKTALPGLGVPRETLPPKLISHVCCRVQARREKLHEMMSQFLCSRRVLSKPDTFQTRTVDFVSFCVVLLLWFFSPSPSCLRAIIKCCLGRL